MFTPLLLGIGLASSVVAGMLTLQSLSMQHHRPMPILTIACLTIIAAFSIVQFTSPKLLPLLMRDRVLVLSGQLWRLATSLLVQDGGYVGTGFNLLSLLAIGLVAERLLGAKMWAIVALVSVTIAQVTTLVWQPSGAGNSILNFGLAGAVCATCLRNRSSKRALLPALIASVCFVLLFFGRDIRGAAALTGAVCHKIIRGD